MPVDTLHPEYIAAAPKWKRMRDVLAGEDAVKSAGPDYLPRLSGQTQEEYDAYRTRAQFFNATGRTHQSLQGFVFRKNPTVKVPYFLAAFMADCTLQQFSFYDYTKGVVSEVLGIGRNGTLVDWSETENRPYLVPYCTEAIHNWKVERIKGQMMLTLLTLFETSDEYYDLTKLATATTAPDPGLATAGTATTTRERDEYDQETYDQWRVYRVLADDAGNLYCRCQVFRKRERDKKEAEFVLIEEKIPTRRGIALDRIPFVFHGPNNGLPTVDRIPLEDMALVNLSLYRTSADLEHGRHFTGLPTPWAAGFPTDGGLKLGSSTAWISETPQASCGFLEFSGGGLTTLEKAVEQKTGQMAALGARMLEPEAKKAEAFDTVAVRSAAETSALMNATVACTQTLSAILQRVAWWTSTAAHPAEFADTATTELNTEFTITSLPSDLLGALVTAYLGGAMDWNSFFWKLQQGEMFPPEADPAKVLANIQNSKPPGIQMPEPTPSA